MFRSIVSALLVAAVSLALSGPAHGQTRQEQISQLKAQIRQKEAELKLLRKQLEQAYESPESPSVPQQQQGQPPAVGGAVSGFNSVFRKGPSGWTQRPTAQGFTFRSDGKRLLATAVEGGDLVFVPGRVRDGADVLGPGWFPAEYAQKAVLASPERNSTLVGGDLSAPFADDPAGWFTIYVYQNGEYKRRKVSHAPDVVISNGHILSTAREGQINYLPYKVNLNGKLLPPGWYRPADPGDVETGK
ncbi:MAG: hypothetical protein U0136_00740 [Bdellovibrionota bacterium]